MHWLKQLTLTARTFKACAQEADHTVHPVVYSNHKPVPIKNIDPREVARAIEASKK